MMDKLVVKVSEGEIQGKIEKTGNNVEYRTFQGIPYAKPPLGDLRFMAPQPPEKWTGIRDATTQGADCYSRSLTTNLIVGSEDCLFLNVYTPKLSLKKTLPVMFWIHGGGFVRGSGNTELFGPDYLIENDVVLVTINYRLGPLGFLAFSNPDTGVPGNAGLKDMVMALKWVQKNIKQFGGDANNVTIFGESAGGSAVHFLILSSTTKGLFHKAISQSGSALNPFARGSCSYTYQLANILGIDSSDEKFIRAELQKIPIEELFEASQKIPDTFAVSNIRPFCPVIEPKSPEAFLTEDPVNIMKSGRYNHVPYVTGFNSLEGLFVYMSMKGDDKTFVKDDFLVPHTLKLRRNSSEYNKVADKIRAMYGVGKGEKMEDVMNILKIHTDTFFQSHIVRTAKLLSYSSKHPIYLYRFDLDTSLNFVKMLSGIDVKGAGHADDLPYFFKTSIMPPPDSDSEEYQLIKKVTTLWTNFAKYGNPTPLNSRSDFNWKPVAKDKLNYLCMKNDLFKLKADPDKEIMDFWENLFIEREILLSKL